MASLLNAPTMYRALMNHLDATRHVRSMLSLRDVMTFHSLDRLGNSCNPALDLSFWNVRTGDEVRLSFRNACATGRVDLARKLMGYDDEKSVHAEGCLGWAFSMACENGHLPAVELLLKTSVNVHGWLDRPFRMACMSGHAEVIQVLLNLTGDRRIGSERMVHSFHLACTNGRTNVVRLLLGLTGDRRVNVRADRDYAFREACANGKPEVAELLLGLTDDRRVDVHADCDYAFREACANGHTEVAELLLGLTDDRRVDVHADRDYAFRQACLYGRSDVIDLLLGLTGDRCIGSSVSTEIFQHACCSDNLRIAKLMLGLSGRQAVQLDMVPGLIRFTFQHNYTAICGLLTSVWEERGGVH
jgi:hypothetical protein